MVDVDSQTMATQIAWEIGINMDIYSSSEDYSMLILIKFNVPYWYLSSRAKKAAGIYLYYEHKSEIPRYLWYTHNANILTIRQMSLPNFREFCKTFIDDTYDEYFSEFTPDRDLKVKDPRRCVFEYQDIPTLIQCASLCPPQLHFETKVGLVMFLINAIISDSRLFDRMIPILTNRWTDPDRALRLEEYRNWETAQSRSAHRYIPIPNVGIGEVVSFTKNRGYYIPLVPPSRFETDYILKIILEKKSHYQAISGVAHQYDIITIHSHCLAARNSVDPNFRPTKEELVYMIRSGLKVFRKVSDLHLRSIFGNITTDTSSKIRESLLKFDKKIFRIGNLDIKYNNTTDVLGNEIVPDRNTISYGDLSCMRAYSVEELQHAFWDPTDHRYVFRKPDDPQNVFTEEEILYLRQRLLSPDHQKFSRFIDLAINSIRFVELDDLNPEDKEHIREILEVTFEVGMYQRTWKGQPSAYPMKKEETQADSDLPLLMTPGLNRIHDLIQELSPEGYNAWSTIPVIIDKRFSVGSECLAGIIEGIRHATTCVAIGSSKLILTGWYHLHFTYHREISGFDINQFELETTHRSGILS